MKKTSVILLIIMLITVFTPVALADNIVDTSALENATRQATENTSAVTSVTPGEGAERINAALMRVYQAGVGIIPNMALVALFIGIVIIVFSAALGLEKYLRLAIAGVFIIFGAVALVYAAPLLMSMAVGIGSGM